MINDESVCKMKVSHLSHTSAMRAEMEMVRGYAHISCGKGRAQVRLKRCCGKAARDGCRMTSLLNGAFIFASNVPQCAQDEGEVVFRHHSPRKPGLF